MTPEHFILALNLEGPPRGTRSSSHAYPQNKKKKWKKSVQMRTKTSNRACFVSNENCNGENDFGGEKNRLLLKGLSSGASCCKSHFFLNFRVVLVGDLTDEVVSENSHMLIARQETTTVTNVTHGVCEFWREMIFLQPIPVLC
ncbi:hypothetical protein CEXT_145901 [Caerostris extrusa]|uniref:Uncharacterized protein n=1 Tax=Caerostris extrusa TaxID=172846 RepID=A0AAV4SW01_CAEEX|nr:hypothetical protein CEXT_145901 [Caerostris extrusa]